MTRVQSVTVTALVESVLTSPPNMRYKMHGYHHLLLQIFSLNKIN